MPKKGEIVPPSPSPNFDDLCERAEQIKRALLAEVELPEVDLPDDMAHYETVAVYTSEAVTQSTNEWGALKLTFKVNGESKWSAMRATDFPGKRLFVVVYAPTSGGDE